ncbi:MAG: RNA-guided pseudouridylation complex pseudouridine synthase subunit Cbf5 [Candidatus Aenigmatarchaeota archaeon]
MQSKDIDDLINFSVINVNKPSGIFCHEIDRKIMNLFNLKKVGHSGTLDPKASGVLVIALGEATKILKFLMESDKEYEGIIYLHKDVNREDVEKLIKNKFIGEIIQIPPFKSRVSRKPRKRKIYLFEIMDKKGKEIHFRIRTQAGTYIRKIAHDIGLELGCGAHLKFLKRTKVGDFDIKHSHTLFEIEEAYNKWKNGDGSPLKKILIPIENALKIKKVSIKPRKIPSVLNGSPISKIDIISDTELKVGEIVGLIGERGEMIGLGVVRTRNKIKTERIFINRNRII